ncbi:MAG TPA: M13 family metallopeptidase [Bryobacteraceae bacterium]|nr:M13 family metallopeptidase [Bryobacteraceae bacterium]
MRLLCALFFTLALSCALAQETPLKTLPYTPSLETAFMDRSANPCVNFYQYACGNWNKLNPIPADQAAWDVYAKMADDNLRFLWGTLEQAARGGSARTANEQKIGDYFGACMDTAAIDAAGAKPLDPALARIAALKSTDDIGAYIGEQHREGTSRNALFGFTSEQDFDNSSQMMAFAAAGGLGLPDRDYYTKTDAKSQEIRQRYVAHVARMLVLLGENASDADTDARAVMQIETAFANASLTRTEKRNPYNLKHKMSREELQRTTPAFDWDAYLKAVDAPAFTTVNVTEPKFFDELNRQLKARKLAEWRAYFRWHLVHSHAQFLSSPFEKESFAFYSEYLQGAKAMPARWKKCTRLVDHQLGEALGQVFVAKTFGPQTKQDALQMVEAIEAEMKRDLEDLSWMSEPTRQQALAKLGTMVNKIGYPDKWRDYSSVEITPREFMTDVRHAAAFEEHRTLNKIGKPVDRSEWGMTPPTVNAYYDPQMNDINFPAGVLQPPLFDAKLDAAPNYGNTGSTMGHELTHGFDDEGRQFDAQGNLRDWWTAADAKAFEDRVACVRDQYAQYVIVDDIHINSRLTLGEDVADLGGTMLAYLAWKHVTAGQDLKPQDGLTPDQRFFVGMAQWACGDERPELKRMRAITDPHSPLEYRVNGVVANLPQFAEAFGCKAGQPMLRTKPCRVW